MQSPPRPGLSRRVPRWLAVGGAAIVGIVAFAVEHIAGALVVGRWPVIEFVFVGLIGTGAAILATAATFSRFAQRPDAAVIRWGAAAAVLFVAAYLQFKFTRSPDPVFATVALLAACLCAWRAERLARRFAHSRPAASLGGDTSLLVGAPSPTDGRGPLEAAARSTPSRR